MDAPTTPAGGKLLTCDLEDTCTVLDCEEVMEQYADALLESHEGTEFVVHYCGLEYLIKRQPPEEPE